MAVNSNLMSKDPEFMVLRSERIELKHEKGCAVCKFRNKKSVFGDRYACDDLTRQPIRGERYCHEWEHDDAIG